MKTWILDEPGRNHNSYDESIVRISTVLRNFSLRGWHCTRLTVDETEEVLRNGMRLSSVQFLMQRISALEKSNVLSAEVATKLRSIHQASDESRSKKIWFSFFPPRLGGRAGIDRLLTNWGGESLYNSHEKNSVTGPVLQATGLPTVITAHIPIRLLSESDINNIAKTMAMSDLRVHGYDVSPYNVEGHLIWPLPRKHIVQIVHFGDPAFEELTGYS